jgi:polar amino acid transport system substrate-binding protein
VNSAKAGDWDGTVALARTLERDSVFWFSDEPVIFGERVLFHLKRVPFHWNTIEDLRGLKIGATLEYYYGEAFEQAEKAKQLTVERVPTDEQNFRKLLAHRIDIFPITREVGSYMLKTLFSPEEAASVTHHPTPLYITEFYLALSKKVTRAIHMLAKFNKELKDSGRYDQLMADYHR